MQHNKDRTNSQSPPRKEPSYPEISDDDIPDIDCPDPDTDTEPTVDSAELTRVLKLIHEFHGVFEIRALEVDRGFGNPVTMGGYFDNVNRAVEAVLLLPPYRGVYFTMNRILPDLLAIRFNRMDVADKSSLTGDRHITRRVLLLVDVDPIKPHAQISATDLEHQHAHDLARQVADTLHRDHGWPMPILFDSGNGYGLWYRIDLPVDDGGLVKRVLESLARHFNTAKAQIDKSVHTASRITKLPGTVARKGDHTPDRPHRVARIIMPVNSIGCVGVVSEELLRAFADAHGAPPDAVRVVPPTVGSVHSSSCSSLHRCIAYLRQLPDSVQGERGSDRMFQAACICIRFGLGDTEAMTALGAYNTEKCQPPWSEGEIHHKLADATRAVDGAGERGCMVDSAHRQIQFGLALRGREVDDV